MLDAFEDVPDAGFGFPDKLVIRKVGAQLLHLGGGGGYVGQQLPQMRVGDGFCLGVCIHRRGRRGCLGG